MTPNELIDISVDIGAALLENGAEIYRVEEFIARICYAYGATETNIYAVPTAIIASFVREDARPVTRVQRIYQRGTNLGRLDQLNTLCREICATPMTYTQVGKYAFLYHAPNHTLYQPIYWCYPNQISHNPSAGTLL